MNPTELMEHGYQILASMWISADAEQIAAGAEYDYPKLKWGDIYFRWRKAVMSECIGTAVTQSNSNIFIQVPVRIICIVVKKQRM